MIWLYFFKLVEELEIGPVDLVVALVELVCKRPTFDFFDVGQLLTAPLIVQLGLAIFSNLFQLFDVVGVGAD